ncbi:MAG: PEP-CTERM sorting domain-containing protein [Armatimonadetes bacterium]|nr:PEP-CTERM sorting domain-containing protein [Armatimonadota bacterium]
MKLSVQLVTIALMVGSASIAKAYIAFDDASDPVYTGGNIHGLNGGYGLGPWTSIPATNSNTAGNFQYTSSQNGNGASGNIDSAGKSWGLYANSNSFSQIYRAITVPMTGYRVVELDFDNGWIDVGQSAYFSIGSYYFGFTGGQSNYSYDTGAGLVDSGLPFSTDGLHAKLILNGSGGWNFSVTSLATNSVWASAQLSGANIPTLISATNINAGFGASNNAYINNIRVTAPEPGSMIALGVGVAAWIRRRRK